MKKALFSLLVLAFLLTTAFTAMAQSESEACAFLQDQITQAESILERKFIEYEQALAQLNEDEEVFGFNILDLYDDNLDLDTETLNNLSLDQEQVRAARGDLIQFIVAFEELLVAAERLDAFQSASFFICDAETTGDTSTDDDSTSTDDGTTVIENTVGEGGDEIIIMTGGNSTPNVAIPADEDDPFNGWYMQAETISSWTRHADGRMDDVGNLVSFALDDNGVLRKATLFFYNNCEIYGNLNFQGENFTLDFSGGLDGTSSYVEVQVQGKILGSTFDDDGRIPVEVTGTAQIYNSEGTETQSATIAIDPSGRQWLQRYDVENYYPDMVCGSG